MKVKFDLTKEDFVAFNLYHSETSEKFKKSVFIQRYIVSLIFLAIPLIGYFVFKIDFKNIAPMFLVIWVIWVIFYGKAIKFNLKKKVETFVTQKEKAGDPVLGEYFLEVDNSGVTLSRKNGSLKSKWKDVEKILEDDLRMYVYIGEDSAYIIPKKAFKNNELEELRKYASEKIKAADTEKA